MTLGGGGCRTTEAKGCRELTQHGVLPCLAGEKGREGNGLYMQYEAKDHRELTQHGVLPCLAGEEGWEGNGLYNSRPKTIEN
jgi:hypothetical protein